MLKRLIIGLILGIVIGAAMAAALVQGLHMPIFTNAAFAYLAAALTGIITGLVAGKPIWSADGKIEAGLKAVFGALLGLGGMFALRQWGHVHVDLTMLKAGEGLLGDLAAASLPAIAAVLGGFYELDNSPSDDAKKEDASGDTSAGKRRSNEKVRIADADEIDDEELDEPVAKKKRR